jgi:S1-C subfamily serine protease
MREDIAVGGVQFERPIVQLSHKKTGLIGSQVLRHFSVTLDSQNQRLFLIAQTNGLVTAKSFRTYGFNFFPTNSLFVVNAVIPKTSAADAKIRIGDVVRKMNGESPSEWTANRRKTFTGPLQVELKRNEKVWTVDLEKTVLIE